VIFRFLSIALTLLCELQSLYLAYLKWVTWRWPCSFNYFRRRGPQNRCNFQKQL